MPISNITIDDVSPFIIYQGSWGDSSHLDNQYVDYFNETFHATNTSGDTASFTFTGTGVYLYGSMRLNHDSFAVTINESILVNGNSFGAPSLFQVPLFGIGDLPYGTHHVVLKNTCAIDATAPYLDLDYIVITVGDQSESTISVDTTMDGSVTAFMYNGEWGAGENQGSRQTNSTQASVTMHFEGNAIAMYGTTGSDHGTFAVSLDSDTPTQLNGSAPVTRPNMLLYRFDGLSDGPHSSTLTNIDSAILDLDYVVVSRYEADTGPLTTVDIPSGTYVAEGYHGSAASTLPISVTTLSQSATGFVTPSIASPGIPVPSNSGHTSSHVPAIVGGVLGGLALCLLLVLSVWLSMRRQQRGVSAQVSTTPHSNQSGHMRTTLQPDLSQNRPAYVYPDPLASPPLGTSLVMKRNYSRRPLPHVPYSPSSMTPQTQRASMLQHNNEPLVSRSRTTSLDWEETSTQLPRYASVYASPS